MSNGIYNTTGIVWIVLQEFLIMKIVMKEKMSETK